MLNNHPYPMEYRGQVKFYFLFLFQWIYTLWFILFSTKAFRKNRRIWWDDKIKTPLLIFINVFIKLWAVMNDIGSPVSITGMQEWQGRSAPPEVLPEGKQGTTFSTFSCPRRSVLENMKLMWPHLPFSSVLLYLDVHHNNQLSSSRLYHSRVYGSIVSHFDLIHYILFFSHFSLCYSMNGKITNLMWNLCN